MISVAKMATFPDREGILRRSVESIVHQVDRLEIYLNNYSFVPNYLLDPKIVTFLGLPDLGDTGKVHEPPEDVNLFLVDDDIIYPGNYVKRYTAKLEQYHHRVVVGCHGALLVNPVRNYFKDRIVTHFQSGLFHDERVHVLGTGTVAYNTNIVRLRAIEISHHNMLDCHLAVHCQQLKIPMICVGRPARWLNSIPTSNSLWSSRGDGNPQTEIINKIPSWNIF